MKFLLKSKQFNTATASMAELVTYLKPVISDHLYPVGRVYISNTSTDPVTLFGIGTWTAISGYTLVGHGGASPLNGNAGTTYGTATHALSEAELAAHYHVDGFAGVNTSGSYGVTTVGANGNINSQSGQSVNYHANTSTIGSGTAHNNVQPSYITYIWLRTS